MVANQFASELSLNISPFDVDVDSESDSEGENTDSDAEMSFCRRRRTRLKCDELIAAAPVRRVVSLVAQNREW